MIFFHLSNFIRNGLYWSRIISIKDTNQVDGFICKCTVESKNGMLIKMSTNSGMVHKLIISILNTTFWMPFRFSYKIFPNNCYHVNFFVMVFNILQINTEHFFCVISALQIYLIMVLYLIYLK